MRIIHQIQIPHLNDFEEVGARLFTFHKEWQDSPLWTRRVITKGITLPWLADPPPLSFPIQKKCPSGLEEIIERLRQQRIIKKVPMQKCFVSPIFTVPKPAGERRFILNLKILNTFLSVPSFKMTNHTTLKGLLPEGNWMASLDIRDAYPHIPVHRNYQKFLAFLYKGELFFFQALLFGLASAPYIFSRVMKHPIQLLRRKGVKILAYLDDLIIWGGSKEELSVHANLTVSILHRLGFLIHQEKSKLQPTQTLIWLGIKWLTTPLRMQLPDQYVQKIVSTAKYLSKTEKITRRELESFQGLVAFAAQVLPEGKLHTHAVARVLRLFNNKERDECLQVPQSLESACLWWTVEQNLLEYGLLRPLEPSIFLWTDASDWGYGAHIDSGEKISGKWSAEERKLHINSKELLAVIKAVKSPLIPQQSQITLAVDNTATYFCIKNQGSKTSLMLQRLTESLYRILRAKESRIVPSHLAGLKNVTADALS